MKNIVVIGGGTGTYVVLSGLKKYDDYSLTAVVAMSDDGGSTGRLRDELGVLPPGDIRQALVALSNEEMLLRQLFNYRFNGGNGLKGHNLGNLLLTALEDMNNGDFGQAVRDAAKLLNCKGEVLPVTFEHTDLCARLEDGTIIKGETIIDDEFPKGHEDEIVEYVYLEPEVKANPLVLNKIDDADYIIVGPGDFYGSIMANLLVREVASSIRTSSAKKIYIPNLMTRWGQKGFKLSDFINRIDPLINIDYLVVNTAPLNEELVKKYAEKNEYPVEDDFKIYGYKASFTNAIGHLVSDSIIEQQSSDVIPRSLIRHDSDILATALNEVISKP